MKPSKKLPNGPPPEGASSPNGKDSAASVAKLCAEKLQKEAERSAAIRHRSNQLMADSRRVIFESEELLTELKLAGAELRVIERKLRFISKSR